MSIFTKSEQSMPKFETRADAFKYALEHLVNENKMDLVEASEKANAFAETFAKNMGIPLKHTPPATGVDKFVENFTKISNCIEKNPKIVEFAVPALTFLVGLLTGNKTAEPVEQHKIPEFKPNQDFDIENLP